MWVVREKQREEELKKRPLNRTNESSDDAEQQKEKEYKISIWTRLYYSKIFRALIIVLAVSMMIPVFLLLFMDTTDPEFDGTHTCSVETGYQIPCGVQNENNTFEKCSALQCCFDESENFCYHKLPSYYKYTQDDKDHQLFQPMLEKTPFGVKNVPVYLNVKRESNTKLMISLSTKKQEKKDEKKIANAEYEVGLFKNVMGVEVSRIINKEMMLTTNHGPTIVSERYWEWTVDLYADHLFGMDFLRIPDNETITKVVYKNAEDHASIARFMSSSSGKFHGLEVEATGPLEVAVTQARFIILRAFSGTDLVLRLVTGPTPMDVYQQFRDQESWTPVPKWMLGVHVCRDGNFADFDEVRTEMTKFHEKNLFPYDSDCIHENLFSLSRHVGHEAEINEVVQTVKSKPGKKFLMSLSPQISTSGIHYNSAEQLDILYKRNKKILEGRYLNESVAYPDYSSPKAAQWFKDLYETEFAQFNPDGLILRNNWPVNEKYKMKNTTKFQYMTKAVQRAMSFTIPWDSVSTSGLHIDVHNSYGLEYTNVVASQAPTAFILSAAYAKGSQYPAHVQNVNASWVNFKNMLRRTLSHSIFAGQFFSVPVCGDTEFFSKEINQGVCVRWYLAASTMPIFRISSEIPRRDPSEYNKIKYVKNIMTDAIKLRYSLLPYYYTILSDNVPMIRPMFFNFPKNNETFDLDEQYMIGDNLLIAHPILFPTPNMKVYLPEIKGGWYEFWGGSKAPETGWLQMPMVEGDLIAFVKAGSIIPMRDETGGSVEETENKPLKIVIACYDKDACTAKGKLFSKDSITVGFEASETTLFISNVESCQETTPDFVISKLKIYGEKKRVLEVPHNQNSFCIKMSSEIAMDYSKFTQVYT